MDGCWCTALDDQKNVEYQSAEATYARARFNMELATTKG